MFISHSTAFISLLPTLPPPPPSTTLTPLISPNYSLRFSPSTTLSTLSSTLSTPCPPQMVSQRQIHLLIPLLPPLHYSQPTTPSPPPSPTFSPPPPPQPSPPLPPPPPLLFTSPGRWYLDDKFIYSFHYSQPTSPSTLSTFSSPLSDGISTTNSSTESGPTRSTRPAP